MQIDRRLTSRPSSNRPRRPLKLSWPGFRFWLIIAALGFVGALSLLLIQVFFYTRTLERLPNGTIIANVPVGDLTTAEARDRLTTVYATPITLDYRGSVFQLDPTQVDFVLDIDSLLAQTVSTDSSTNGLWAYLWGEVPPTPQPIPLQATYDESKLETFLAEVAARYDEAGSPAVADPLTLSFTAGSAGRSLDRNAAFTLINAALRSATNRTVVLPVTDFASTPPTFATLADLLATDIRLHQFEGLVHLYLADLQTGETLNLAVNNNQLFPINDGIAISGMSTIKIPVMVTFFRYKDGTPTPDEQLLLDGIFAESANAYTDLILGIIGGYQQGGGLVGTNMMSDTMFELGLKNTYLAGLLDTLGAITTPRLTPGNTRTDIDLNPDLYSQTSADDMGRLMVMIYQCSKGGGPLMETFLNQFTAEECQTMIDILSENAVGPIFIAGSAPGAKVIHKHGWDLIPLNNVADAAIVESAGGNYAVTVYIHRDEPVAFDTANRLIVSLGTAVFNFYNRK